MSAAIAAAAATALFVATALASELDSAIRARNAKKANKINKQLQAVIRQNNIKQDQLDQQLSKMNLNYTTLMENLNNVVRGGRAWDIQQQALKEYKDKTLSIENQKKKLQQETDLAANSLSAEVDKYSNRGLYDVIGGIINL